MNFTDPAVSAPALVWFCAAVLLTTPEIAARNDRRFGQSFALALLMGLAVAVPVGAYSYAALAAISIVNAAAALRASRTSALTMGIAALACAIAAGALWMDNLQVGFGASLVAIAIHCGLFPLHGGVAALCDKY